jgi:hypothetical protein
MSRWTKTFGRMSATLFAAALLPTLASAQEFEHVRNYGDLRLGGYGSFFIQGETHAIDADTARGGTTTGTVAPGLSMINQMYVQFMLPDKQKGKKSKRHTPIGIIHGCCLSTKSWQTTPDGRMGWDEYFVRVGFDTYMMDQVGRARSGFDATKYNMVRTDNLPCTAGGTAPSGNTIVCQELPAVLIATDQFAWNVFRWGTTPCTVSPCSETTTPHPDLKFPLKTIGVGPRSNLQFYNQVIPDMTATLSGAPSPADPAGFYNSPSQMAKLASKVGGMTLMGHSQSSSFPTRAALQPESGCYPWRGAKACKVKGIIQIETGCFGNLTEEHVNTLKHIPILVIDGDHYPTPRPVEACVTMMDQINGAGGDMSFAHLPALTKNSLYRGSPGPMPGIEHMMMIGTKNIEVANLIIGWLTSRGL